MIKVIKILFINTFLLSSLACERTADGSFVILPQSENLIVGNLNTLSISQNGESTVYTARYVEDELVGFSLAQNASTANYTLQKNEQGQVTGYSLNESELTTYEFTPNGSLKEINHPDGLKERIALNSSGQWEYHYKQREQDGSTVYEEIRQYHWENGQIAKMVTNRPSVDYEEETFSYTEETNPFINFKSEWPLILGFDTYLISPLMPESSIRTFSGQNLKYAYTLNGDEKLLSFTLEKQDEENPTFQPYIIYEMTYHEK